MNEPQPTQRPPSSPILKAAWFLLATIFVLSLIASITMIVQTLSWISHHGPDLPPWFHPLTLLSEWALALSSLGLLALAIATVLRNYRDR